MPKSRVLVLQSSSIPEIQYLEHGVQDILLLDILCTKHLLYAICICHVLAHIAKRSSIIVDNQDVLCDYKADLHCIGTVP